MHSVWNSLLVSCRPTFWLTLHPSLSLKWIYCQNKYVWKQFISRSLGLWLLTHWECYKQGSDPPTLTSNTCRRGYLKQEHIMLKHDSTSELATRAADLKFRVWCFLGLEVSIVWFKPNKLPILRRFLRSFKRQASLFAPHNACSWFSTLMSGNAKCLQ